MKGEGNMIMKIQKFYPEGTSVVASNLGLKKTKSPKPCGCAHDDSGTLAIIDSQWKLVDYIGAILCRISAFRNRYSIQPGLYRIGNPNSDSDVFVGACALNCPSKAIEVRSGVGCATAVLNGRFGIGSSECSCSSDNKTQCC